MEPAEDSFGLSTRQKEVVAGDANFLLKACPGSGKTHTVAARIARLMSDGASIAACSYTNVGVAAVRNALAAQQQSVVEPRHFVGTLHGFLLRHVTYPFGHMTYGVTMRLLRDESSIWPTVDISDAASRRVALPLFRMRPDGSMRLAQVPQNVGLPESEVLRRGEGRARTLKRDMAARGWISSDDAMYIAMRVLREHPDITRAVAGRYDELLVDEAQDTNELQLECLRLLATSGALRSLVLIGDPEQAISSYAGASAQGCDDLAKHCGLTTMSLTENYRSSQKICDLASYFSSQALPDTAVGRDAEHSVIPQFVVYPAEQPRRVVTTFIRRLEELGEDPQQSAILLRSNAFRDEVSGFGESVRVLPRPLSFGRAVAKVRGARTLDRRDVESIDRIVSQVAFDDEELTRRLPHERLAIRDASIRFLTGAPSLKQDLQTWIRASAALLTEIVQALVPQPARTGGSVLRTSASHAGHIAEAVFQAAPSAFRAQTVHDVKGESRDAVLIVLDRQRGRSRGSRPAQTTMWASRLRGEGGSPDDAEEVRIAFVALTRARRYCLIAIPDDSSLQTVAAFADAGLDRLDVQWI